MKSTRAIAALLLISCAITGTAAARQGKPDMVVSRLPEAHVSSPLVDTRESIFEWRDLERLGIPVIVGVGVVVFQAGLIMALLFQRVLRRRAEKEAIDLTGRLLTAYEDERRCLAREMHDDLTQRLARLAIDAGRMETDLAAPQGMRPLREDLVRLSEDVHALSYRLHPSMLDDLGLVEALKAECDRVAQHGAPRVEFEAREVPKELADETSLCLYRIAQEALRNAVQHARASAVRVFLSAHGKGLQLAVSDNGSGFDPALPPEHASLGLASMRERVRLLHGKLDIQSTPGHGTSVVAWVPVMRKVQ